MLHKSSDRAQCDCALITYTQRTGRKHTIMLIDMHIAVSTTEDRNNEITCTEMHEKNPVTIFDNSVDVSYM